MVFLRISLLSKIYGKIVLLKRKKKIKQKEICAYFLFLIMEFLILILTRSYVTRSCYTLLHQVKRIEGKIAWRSAGYFRFWSWSSTIFLYYTSLILIYDMLRTFRFYFIQFKEVWILWGPGAEAESQIRGPEARG